MTDDAMRKAAEALFDVAPFRSEEGPFEAQTGAYQDLCHRYARAAVAAWLRAWEPSEEAEDTAFGTLASDAHHEVPLVAILKAAARAEAERIEGDDD